MCNPHDLANAAPRLRKVGDRNRVLDVAKRMRRNKATADEIAWAKRITVGVRNVAVKR